MTMKLVFRIFSLLQAPNCFIQVFAASVYWGSFVSLLKLSTQNLNKYLSLFFFFFKVCLFSLVFVDYKIPQETTKLPHTVFYVEIQ